MSTKKYFKEIFTKDESQDFIIDAVRALSVLSIIAFHVMVGITQIFDAEKTKEYILNMPAWLTPLWHGEKGVDAFFLISATVLGLSLFKKTNSFGTKDALDFYKKRFFRIYPLFLIALCLYTIGQWSYFGKYFFTNALLINNLLPNERTIIPVGWSLLVEVQYYALLPILFFILKTTKHRLAILVTLFLSSFVVNALTLLQNPELYLRPLTDLFLAPDKDSFSHTLGALFYEANRTRYGVFILGLILAYLKINHFEKLKTIYKNTLVSHLSLLVGGIIFILSVTIPVYSGASWYNQNFSAHLHFLMLTTSRQIFGLSLFLIIFGCWFSPNSNIFFNFIKKKFNLKTWLPISKLSFSIYLFHFPMIAVAAVVVFQTTNIKSVISISLAQGFSIFTLATVLSVLFSIPMYVFVERPFIQWAKNKNSPPMV